MEVLNAIFHVLLMHCGPTMLKFELDLNLETEFDQIILYLSRKINVKDLIINTWHTFYKQPSSFFSLQGLESLELINSSFEPPIDYDEVSVEEMSFNFVKLFQCGMPHKLPTSLHLKYVQLDVCLREQDVISSVLCIIRSSPNLEQLSFAMYDNKELPIQESSIKFDDLHDDLSLTLDHLKRFEIVNFSDNVFEMKFVKLIMAKSPVPKIARVELRDFVSVVEELKILR
ncbi:uncharacterized protein [Rutidosis leptorrhynchoides]|uniref:uncharacterized protein n=1 Tax=Rutidosis leptorrhynchoides TaxID=125765 RepID=UPI003A98E01C